jgi:hypothetical protein
MEASISRRRSARFEVPISTVPYLATGASIGEHYRIPNDRRSRRGSPTEDSMQQAM